jgi:transcription elongation factor Elf1
MALPSPKTCPICESKNLDEVSSCAIPDEIVSKKSITLQCKDCGAVYTQFAPVRDTLENVPQSNGDDLDRR